MAHFYDELADDYHLIYSDWDASIRRQGDALIGQDRAEVLDCSCGIGTQAIGLALRGHRVTGTDLSPRAAARAAREAARRSLSLRTAAADMRRLPFSDGRFDVVVCANNSLPHLLTEQDVHAALASMRRVLRVDHCRCHTGPGASTSSTSASPVQRWPARRMAAVVPVLF